MKHHKLTPMQWLAIIVVALSTAACASMGRPEGGPRDYDAPVFVSSRPAVGALRVSQQVMDLYFNENVQLEDPLKKVVVSPVQKSPARVTANGRHVRVQFQDTLKPNTTYTIDFADAIKDLNEGNVLDGFATYFSTGDTIDSLAISGMVLEARTLEPAQGMLVGVYSNLADSAIRTLQPDRIARTNQLGQFSVLNLKPGQYRIYAFNDVDNDYKWKESEDIAFYDMIVEPRVEDIMVTDTLRAWNNEDSLVERSGIQYLPNDILLTWYTEKTLRQYVKDHKRDVRNKINLYMGTPSDSMPKITIANGTLAGADINDWALVQGNVTCDSITYWITDTTVVNTDSLYLSVSYFTTVDTIPEPFWRADTLKFFFKEPKSKKPKKEEAEEADTVSPPLQYINLRTITPQRHEVYMPLIFASDQPIDTVLASGVRVEMARDTIWEPINVEVVVDSLNPLLNRRIYHQWKPGEKYRLTLDSAAVVSVYGEHNKVLKHEFTVKELEEYANLAFNVTPADQPMMVEILDKSDKVLRAAPVIDGKASIKYLEPGTVYARLYIDANSNGKWDPGRIDTIQPEEVYYYAKKINLKKNWDVTNDWNIYELPIDKQKPNDIKKNKPKLKKGQREETTYDEEEDEEDFDMFGGYNNAYDNSRRNNNNRNNNNRNNNNRNTRSSQGMGGIPRFR